MSKGRFLLVLLAAVVVVAGFVRLSVDAGRGGETMPLYTVQRFDPYGTAALHRLMQRRAERVLTLERPRLSEAMRQLRDGRGTLLQVLSLPDDAALQNMTEWGEVVDDPYRLPTPMLLEWVAQGNTLIQLTRRSTAVMEELGVAWDDAWDDGVDLDMHEAATHLQKQQRAGVVPEELDDWEVRAQAVPLALEGEAVWVTLRSPRGFLAEQPAGWEPLLVDGTQALAGRLPHGEGQVIFVGSPSPVLNHTLDDADNLGWVLGLVGEGTVIFDEWAHGVGHGGTIIETLAHFGLVPLLLQLPVWLRVYRWSAAGRQAPPAEQAPRARGGREQVDTLGRLLAQAWDRGEVRRRVYDEVVGRFAAALRCRPEEVEGRLRQRGGDAGGRALELLREARALATVERPRCPRCGYELSGIKPTRCPECGRAVPRRIARLMERDSFTAADAGPADQRRSAPARILDRSSTLAQELSSD
jgi:hypothetical protein